MKVPPHLFEIGLAVVSNALLELLHAVAGPAERAGMESKSNKNT